MDSDSNKYTYWVFTIQAINGTPLPGEHEVDQALARSMDKYLFQKEVATSAHYQGCCKTRIRKRKNTVLNELVTELDIQRAQVTISPMQGTWEQAKAYCSKLETAEGPVYSNEVVYTGADIEVLDSKEKRYSWQNSIIDLLFVEDTSSIKVADDRSIIWITDTKGGTGKSKLVKWCCVHNDNIIKISFGTSSQLRSAIISAGPRRLYFVDIPRTLGSDDSVQSLMSALEDLKNGYVVSSMYGKNESLILDPPHIVVFSNIDCPSQMMTKDRWRIYVINYLKELIDLTPGVPVWEHS